MSRREPFISYQLKNDQLGETKHQTKQCVGDRSTEAYLSLFSNKLIVCLCLFHFPTDSFGLTDKLQFVFLDSIVSFCYGLQHKTMHRETIASQTV